MNNLFIQKSMYMQENTSKMMAHVMCIYVKLGLRGDKTTEKTTVLEDMANTIMKLIHSILGDSAYITGDTLLGTTSKRRTFRQMYEYKRMPFCIYVCTRKP